VVKPQTHFWCIRAHGTCLPRWWELTAVPQIPQLDLRGLFEASKEGETEGRRRKERQGTEGLEKRLPRYKFVVTFLDFRLSESVRELISFLEKIDFEFLYYAYQKRCLSQITVVF